MVDRINLTMEEDLKNQRRIERTYQDEDSYPYLRRKQRIHRKLSESYPRLTGKMVRLRDVFISPRQRERDRQEKQALENELVQTRRDQERKDALRERERQEANTLDRQRRHKAAEKLRIENERLAAEQRKEEQRLRKLKQASPETLRTLRELIRNRYELDVKIWGLRGARRPDRPIVEDKMEKADAVMQEILEMVWLWGNNADRTWIAEEWVKVQSIRKRLQEGGRREWAGHPPWDERV
jgi:hypothetical protein